MPLGDEVASARLLMGAGRYADAASLLQRALAGEPQEPLTRCLLASCYINLDRHEEAARMAESAIALAPDLSFAHRLRSIALNHLGKAKPAVAAAQEAVRLSPDDPDAMVTLGEAQLENKQLDEAKRWGERVVALEPLSDAGHYLLGLVAVAQKRWRVAEKHCREALRLDPRNWAAMNNLGVALQGQGRHKEAIHAFENAAKLNPKADVARGNLFHQTQRYLLGAIGLALFLVTRALVASRASPMVLLLVLGLTLAGVAIVMAIRRRRLSRTVRTFYDIESRRRLLRTIVYFVGFYGVTIAVLVLLILAYTATANPIALLAMVGAVIGWWYGWHRLWRVIEPRLPSR